MISNDFIKNKKESIFDIFRSLYKARLKTDSNFILSIDTLNEILDTSINTLRYTISTEEREDLIKTIKSSFDVYQEEGSAILGDYEHDYSWYEKLIESLDESNSYWGNYRYYLLTTKNFPIKVVDTINFDMNKVMSYIGNPNQDCPYNTRGLVVGDVQSGKTSNYIALITKAADAGYKVFFVLTGTIESLRRQTQIRIEEGFVGYDVVNGVDVGVGRQQDKMPRSFTSRNKDFVSSDDQNTLYNTSNSTPMIFVVKKNVSVLSKIYSSLKKLNTKHEGQKITQSCLVIDDEADNASINTNKPNNDPTKINSYIRKILSLFTKTAYVGFTATPFANVFIGYDSNDAMLKDDLFPKDFIYALKSPSNYFGAKQYFVNDNSNIRIIDDFDENKFPLKHKKEFEPNASNMFESFFEAINCFLLINAIRDLREKSNKNTHRSMLINMTRFTNVQFCISSIVEDYLDKIKRDVKQCSYISNNLALENNSIKSLRQTYDNQFANISKFSWEDVLHSLYESIKNIVIRVVNSSKNSKKLDYESYKKVGLRVIAIGGLALSRGLTLEGLCVSYFYRNTAVFDVLMQMGRWFGYKEEYADLCRIYLTKKSKTYYAEISKSIEELKNEIDKMGREKKTPTEYGIRVRNDSLDLIITASNKMRGTKVVIDRKSFYGNLFETSYLYRDLHINECNIDYLNELFKDISLSKKDNSIAHPYFRDIPTSVVLKFINEVTFNEDNGSFDKDQIVKFINKHPKEITKFDVLIMGGNSSKIFTGWNGKVTSNLVTRKYDIQNDIIRMNGQRAHLWGKLDTKNGLSKEIIKLNGIDEKTAKAEDYLIKGRNPLLIVYLVDPGEYARSNDEYTSKEDMANELKFIKDLENSKYKYLLGIAIGFPKSETNKNDENAKYVVNRTQNYYEREHDENEVVEE